jgi:hypothetical protein
VKNDGLCQKVNDFKKGFMKKDTDYSEVWTWKLVMSNDISHLILIDSLIDEYAYIIPSYLFEMK